MASATSSPSPSAKTVTARSTTPSFMRPTAASQARAQHSTSAKSTVRYAMSKPSRNSISPSKRLASSSSAKRPSVMTGRVAPKATNETSTTVSEKHPVTINGGVTTTPPSAPTQVASNLAAAKGHKQQDSIVDNSADTIATEKHEATAEPTKRKRDEDDSEEIMPTTDKDASKRVSKDSEPAEKKRKAIQKKITAARQNARRDTDVEDSDGEVIVIPQRKRKVAAKTSTPPKKPILDDFDRCAMREAERFRRDAQKGKLAKGKFLRSFNDTIAGSYARRNYVTPKPTVAGSPVSTLRPVTSQPPKVAPHKATTKKPVVEEKKAESTPIVIDEKDPNVRIVDLTVIKSLRTGADGMTTASLDNIMKAPELYPNVEITYNDAGKPIQARVVTLGPDEWMEMLKASKARARQQRTQATKQARKVALENGDFFKATRVTKRKGTRRLAPNLKKP